MYVTVDTCAYRDVCVYICICVYIHTCFAFTYMCGVPACGVSWPVHVEARGRLQVSSSFTFQDLLFIESLSLNLEFLFQLDWKAIKLG